MKARAITVSALAATAIIAGFIFIKYYFQFGEGVRAGELNQFVLKGYVFKTYEGRLIQSGFRGSRNPAGTGASIESYIFEFSVEDQAIADSLMRLSGKTVELHYKEYLGALPWRGFSKNVVDKILSVGPASE